MRFACDLQQKVLINARSTGSLLLRLGARLDAALELAIHEFQAASDEHLASERHMPQGQAAGHQKAGRLPFRPPKAYITYIERASLYIGPEDHCEIKSYRHRK